MIHTSHFPVDALRITPTGSEARLLNPCPVALELAPHISDDMTRLERYDLTLSVNIAPDHLNDDSLREALAPVLAPLTEIPTGSPWQIETWTATAGTEIPWQKTTLARVDQVDTGALHLELVEPEETDDFAPYVRVTFLRAVARPGEDGHFYRVKFGADDLAPPSTMADA
ncbi:hypothetical protein [Streptomyces sp. 2P-4]|uniref:hypothetical protein n=1 Tax=Streptomyces sp. 2P-4 TaxID=2931974 RepID=UPI00253FEF82|nr:hypothetical protein [Streptomyces sp. 2P-4]